LALRVKSLLTSLLSRVHERYRETTDKTERR